MKMENIISSSARSAEKAISKFVGWVINFAPESFRRTVNTGAENLKTKIK